MTMPKAEWDALPWKVRDCISREHVAIGESNACDHRPTMQSEIDHCTELRVRQYQQYLEIRKAISDEDDARTLRLFKLECKGWGLQDDYYAMEVAGKWVYAPRYMHWYDKMVRLKKVLA